MDRGKALEITAPGTIFDDALINRRVRQALATNRYHRARWLAYDHWRRFDAALHAYLWQKMMEGPGFPERGIGRADCV